MYAYPVAHRVVRAEVRVQAGGRVAGPSPGWSRATPVTRNSWLSDRPRGGPGRSQSTGLPNTTLTGASSPMLCSARPASVPPRLPRSWPKGSGTVPATTVRAARSRAGAGTWCTTISTTRPRPTNGPRYPRSAAQPDAKAAEARPNNLSDRMPSNLPTKQFGTVLTNLVSRLLFMLVGCLLSKIQARSKKQQPVVVAVPELLVCSGWCPLVLWSSSTRSQRARGRRR